VGHTGNTFTSFCPPARNLPGARNGETGARDPCGVVVKPDGPDRVAPKLTDPALPMPDNEGVEIAHEASSSALPGRPPGTTRPRGWIITSRPRVRSAFRTLPISAVSLPRSNSDKKRVLRLPSPETVSSVRCRCLRWVLLAICHRGWRRKKMPCNSASFRTMLRQACPVGRVGLQRRLG
jgi:hypothetical protein